MSSSCRRIVIPIVVIITVTIILLLRFPRQILFYLATDEEDYPSYKDCAPSICGNSIIRYPFGKCGPGHSDCLDNRTLQITLYGQSTYGFPARVIGNITESSYYTRTLQIAQDIHFGDSSVFAAEYVFDPAAENVFNLSQGHIVGTILNCTQQNRHINKTLTRLDWGETDRHWFFYDGSYYDFCGLDGRFCKDCGNSYSVVVLAANSHFSLPHKLPAPMFHKH